MKPNPTLLGVAAMVLVAACSTHASVTFYTDLASFQGVIPETYNNNNNNFSTLASGDLSTTSLSYSYGTPQVSYTISTLTPALNPGSNLYGMTGSDRAIGSVFATDLLLTTIDTGNAYWAGANFFSVAPGDVGNSSSITVTFTFADTTTHSATVAGASSAPYGFYGIYSTVPITSFTAQRTVTSTFAMMDNLYVSAVPEPHEYALVAGLGLLAFAGYRRMALKTA